MRVLANRGRAFSTEGVDKCQLHTIWAAGLMCSTKSKEASVAGMKGEEKQ